MEQLEEILKEQDRKERAKEILGKLTLEEKIGMIHGAQLFQTAGVERLGILPLKMSDGPMGVRQEFAGDSWKAVGHSDDYVTYLPCNSALAATWNRQLAYQMGSVLGEEARGRGKDVILAPGVNLKRSPLCGRNFEYFSEDPYLTKEMAVPYIQGVQVWDVAACVKHFAANNQETQRLWVDVEIEEQVLREVYLPVFYEAVMRGGSYTIMGAYNKVKGEHCCQSEFLLNQILRKEWGYDGVVISDWGGVHDTVEAANSQLDIEMSVTNDFDQYFMAEPLKEKILSGEIDEAVVDEKVIRILMLMMRLHMMDGKRKSGAYNTPEHRQVALEVTRESIVLLKNKRKLLPLDPEKLKRVLVIGENAEQIHSNGGGSAEIKALYEISPLMGLKSHLGGNVLVDYIQGYCRDEEMEQGEQKENWQENSLENGGGQTKALTADREENKVFELEEKRQKLRQQAVGLAGEYDTVIYIGGLNHEQDCEGRDRADMRLPYEQDRLIGELLDIREDMIVVLTGGSAVEMGSWIERADTLVWGWYGGMEGGNALAEVLLGKVNPSGRLPESFYRTHLDCSAHALGEFAKQTSVKYTEGRYIGYRYLDAYGIEPQFCFGYGIGYSEFVWRNGRLDRERGMVFCLIKNIGEMDGSEVIQVYRKKLGDAAKNYKELIGFDKVFLLAGEEKEVFLGVCWEEGYEYFLGKSVEECQLVDENRDWIEKR